MNVDILKDNPDWRWYILFGGASLILTLVGWLTFKYTSVRHNFWMSSSGLGTDKRRSLKDGLRSMWGHGLDVGLQANLNWRCQSKSRGCDLEV